LKAARHGTGFRGRRSAGGGAGRRETIIGRGRNRGMLRGPIQQLHGPFHVRAAWGRGGGASLQQAAVRRGEGQSAPRSDVAAKDAAQRSDRRGLVRVLRTPATVLSFAMALHVPLSPRGSALISPARPCTRAAVPVRQPSISVSLPDSLPPSLPVYLPPLQS
jgi:hypothetical protein